ncbi:DUF4062 domain-containing protein [Flavobacterium sp. RHBU_3]|uniref:DUF4062 domain-containing protein n=1 Tax=Flavobacterium sp. RHBU_3 TaxID=3391184 RepID=UPI003984D8BE
MKDKKLQVFVSSTYIDLKEERQAAVEAILSAGHIPAGMELFSAGDESQMTVIKRWIDESDVYLLILGGRYGSVEPTSGKSYTHLEYEYAIEQGKPLFAVVINQPALDQKVKANGMTVIEQDSPHLLKEFKSQVLSNLVKFFDDKKDIKLAVHETLSEFNYRKELTGWVRGDNAVNTGLLAEEIARLTKENSDLRIELSKSRGASEALYSGLTYEELKSILSKKKFIYDGNTITFFTYIVEFGSHFMLYTTSNNPEAIRELLKLGLIVRMNTGYLCFTEVGRSFYLRTTIQENK